MKNLFESFKAKFSRKRKKTSSAADADPSAYLTTTFCRVGRTDSVHAVVSQMAERGVSAALIVGNEGKLLGIFTEKDAVRVIAETRSGTDLRQVEVETFMTGNPITVNRGTPASQALSVRFI